MRIFFLTVLLLLFIVPAFSQADSLSQGTTIKGWIKDSIAQNQLEGAVVSLMTTGDSSLVKTTFSETDGSYILEGIAPGSYFIYITLDGFSNHSTESFAVKENEGTQEVAAILLSKKTATELEGFSVVAKIPLVIRKIDRTVVNVDAMVSAAGNSVLELLEKSPGVIVDQSGNIMLKGKAGALIYVDDKPTYLSGDALTNFLRSMPASSVSQVEIITTPPAKYDAAGNVGIINIITKKSKVKGFNGSFTLSYGQGKYAKTNNSFNFNYRNNKVNVFGSLSGGVYNGFNDLYINRTYKNDDLSVQSHFNQNSQIKIENKYGNGRLGMDYYVTDKTTLGVTASLGLSNSFVSTWNISELSDPSKQPTGFVYADNTRENEFGNGSVNLNLRHSFDSTGRNVSFDFDHVRYSMTGNAGFANDTYSADGTHLANDRLDGYLPAEIAIYSAKTDYTHPFGEKMSFSTGAKASYTEIDNLVDYRTTANGITAPDYTKSNHFIYDEMITAAYANFTQTIKRFSYQVGLRGEGTLSRGNQLGNALNAGSRFHRDYASIFPTGYVSYSLDSAEKHNLNLSYGRRIDRPFYQDLNPFVEPLDKFTYYTGNPMLRPMFSNTYSLTYGYQHYFSATFSYMRTKNEINETIEINEDQLYFSRPGNLGRSENITLGLNATIPFAKWLNSTFYTEVANLRYNSQLYTETLKTNGTYFYAYMSNSFTIGKGWSAELTGYYVSDVRSAQFTLLQRGQLGIAVQKKILKDKGTVKVNVQDIFYTNINNGIINNLRLTYADYKNKPDSRVVFFSFSYAFGKPFQSGPKREGGAESEQNRVKN